MKQITVIYIALSVCVASSAYLLVGSASPSAATYFTLQFIAALLIRHQLWPSKYLYHSEKLSLSSRVLDYVMVFGSIFPNQKNKSEENNYLIEIAHSKKTFSILAGVITLLPIIYFLTTKRFDSLPFIGSYFIFYCIAITTLFSTHLSQLMIPLIISTITTLVTLTSLSYQFSFFYIVFLVSLLLAFRAFSQARSNPKNESKFEILKDSYFITKQSALFLIVFFLLSLIVPEKNRAESMASRSKAMQLLANNVAKGLMRFSDDPQKYMLESFLGENEGDIGTGLANNSKKEELGSTGESGDSGENGESQGSASSKVTEIKIIQEIKFEPLSKSDLNQMKPQEVIREIEKLKGVGDKNRKNPEALNVPIPQLKSLLASQEAHNSFHRKLYSETQKKAEEDSKLLKSLEGNEKAKKLIQEGQKKDVEAAQQKLKAEQSRLAKDQLDILQKMNASKNKSTSKEMVQLKKGTPLNSEQIKSLVESYYEKAAQLKSEMLDEQADENNGVSKNAKSGKSWVEKEKAALKDKSEENSIELKSTSHLKLTSAEIQKMDKARQSILKSAKTASDLSKESNEKIAKEIQKIVLYNFDDPSISNQNIQSVDKLAKSPKKMQDSHSSIYFDLQRQKLSIKEKLANAQGKPKAIERLKNTEKIAIEQAKKKLQTNQIEISQSQIKEIDTLDLLRQLPAEQSNQLRSKKPLNEAQIKSLLVKMYLKSKNGLKADIAKSNLKSATEKSQDYVLKIGRLLSQDRLNRKSNDKSSSQDVSESVGLDLLEALSNQSQSDLKNAIRKGIFKQAGDPLDQKGNNQLQIGGVKLGSVSMNRRKGSKNALDSESNAKDPNSVGDSSDEDSGSSSSDAEGSSIGGTGAEGSGGSGQGMAGIGGAGIGGSGQNSLGNSANLGLGQNSKGESENGNGAAGDGKGDDGGSLKSRKESPILVIGGTLTTSRTHIEEVRLAKLRQKEGSKPKDSPFPSLTYENNQSKKDPKQPNSEIDQTTAQSDGVNEQNELSRNEHPNNSTNSLPAIDEPNSLNEENPQSGTTSGLSESDGENSIVPDIKSPEALGDNSRFTRPSDDQLLMQEEEKELAEKIEKSLEHGLRLFQLISFIVIFFSVLYFIQRMRSKHLEEKSKIQLSKDDIESILKDFKRLNQMQGKPGEEVLRSYYTFLRLMDMVDHPRPSSLPATDYSCNLAEVFQPISYEVKDLTNEFCHHFYGHRQVKDPSLNKVRTDRSKILKYFIS
ncbi:MAG: hypothetical protein KDD61_13885 [Bdellovibrionales bacterium]|nr:hypothetical protein [Bdellovibrionales bacterium]